MENNSDLIEEKLKVEELVSLLTKEQMKELILDLVRNKELSLKLIESLTGRNELDKVLNSMNTIIEKWIDEAPSDEVLEKQYDFDYYDEDPYYESVREYHRTRAEELYKALIYHFKGALLNNDIEAQYSLLYHLSYLYKRLDLGEFVCIDCEDHGEQATLEFIDMVEHVVEQMPDDLYSERVLCKLLKVNKDIEQEVAYLYWMKLLKGDDLGCLLEDILIAFDNYVANNRDYINNSNYYNEKIINGVWDILIKNSPPQKWDFLQKYDFILLYFHEYLKEALIRKDIKSILKFNTNDLIENLKNLKDKSADESLKVLFKVFYENGYRDKSEIIAVSLFERNKFLSEIEETYDYILRITSSKEIIEKSLKKISKEFNQLSILFLLDKSEELMERLLKNNSLSYWMDFAPKLSKENESIALSKIKEILLSMTDNTSDRYTYKNWAKLINEMASISEQARKEARELALTIMSLYRRPAMREEFKIELKELL